jgi:FKBP-type peptidyl-prolyl cis-trans isomerase FkpA
MHRLARVLVAAALATGMTSAACQSSTSPSQGYDIGALAKVDTVLGTGAEAVAGKTATVHYTGWTYSPSAAGNKGTQFETSAGGAPLTFTLGSGQVISGWDQGIAGMKVGGKRTLMIPSSLAYGGQGSGSKIPPYSALVFDIELLGVQ